jgi:GNAT superfamily N-acetyltransferase
LSFPSSTVLPELELAIVQAAWKRPDTIIDQRPGWYQLTTPSSKQHWFNGIVESKLSASEAPARVAEVIAHYKKLGSRFRWTLGPSATPADLGKILTDHGLSADHVGYGMARESALDEGPIDPRIQVERATLENVEDYVAATALGWGNTYDASQEILQDMRRCLVDPSHPTLYFLARYGGKAVASGALLPFQRSGYLLASSVAPEFRKKGIYRALVAHRLRVLKERGIPLATIYAMSHTSAPICRKLGFETICEIQAYLGGTE